MTLTRLLTSKWTKAVLFAICLLPIASLVWKALHGGLTANPVEFITHATGDWTIRFLIITLTITPLRKITRVPAFIRFRRMLGLFAFFYAGLHFTTYIWLDKFFNIAEIWTDIHKRRFITVGFAALVLLIPLAVTSTGGAIRRLGGRRWQALHRLIYLSAVLGVVHYYWLVKSDVRKPLEYAWMVGLLLVFRLSAWIVGRGKSFGAGGGADPAGSAEFPAAASRT